MSIEAEIRRTNAWVKRRIRPSRMPRDERPFTDYEFQIPSAWLNNLAKWAKMMLVVITLSMIAGYASVFLWVFDNVGHFREAVIDAYGDILVTLIVGCACQDLNLVTCLEDAYGEIKNRKGFLNSDGVFVKEV